MTLEAPVAKPTAPQEVRHQVRYLVGLDQSLMADSASITFDTTTGSRSRRSVPAGSKSYAAWGPPRC